MPRPAKPVSIKIEGTRITFDIADDRHAVKALKTYMTSLSYAGAAHISTVTEIQRLLERKTNKEVRISSRLMRMSPMRAAIISLFDKNRDRDFVRAEVEYYMDKDEIISQTYEKNERGIYPTVDACLKWLVKTDWLYRTDTFRTPHEGEHFLSKPVRSYSYRLTEDRIEKTNKKVELFEKAIVTTHDHDKLKRLRGYPSLKVIFGTPDNENAQYIAKMLHIEYKYFLKVPNEIPDDMLLVS